jgi:hypothetical protein
MSRGVMRALCRKSSRKSTSTEFPSKVSYTSEDWSRSATSVNPCGWAANRLAAVQRPGTLSPQNVALQKPQVVANGDAGAIRSSLRVEMSVYNEIKGPPLTNVRSRHVRAASRRRDARRRRDRCPRRGSAGDNATRTGCRAGSADRVERSPGCESGSQVAEKPPGGKGSLKRIHEPVKTRELRNSPGESCPCISRPPVSVRARYA